MTRKNRIGFFFIFCGSLALLIFWASIKAHGPSIYWLALLIGVGSLALGVALFTSKRRAPPPPAVEEVPCPPPPAPKRRGAFSGLFRRRPPAPASAPPPAKK